MTTETPFGTPEPFTHDPARAVPEEVLKQIKTAWIAAVVSACATLLFTVLAISGTEIAGFSAWQLLDVVLVFGLAIGIYLKSRVSAVLMFAYFVGSKIIFMVQTGAPSGLLMGLIFSYFFWQGVSGTFAYHKIMQR